MKRTQKELIVILSVGTSVFMAVLCLWYQTYMYLKDQKQEAFHNRVAVIADHIKDISNRNKINIPSMRKLVSILDEVTPEKFSTLVNDIVSRETYVSSMTFYKHIGHSQRQELENNYPDGFIATDPNNSDELITTPIQQEYLVSHAANDEQAENIYMGWDLYSDSRLGPLVKEALSSNTIQVSNPYLLDEGDSALDVLIPIMSNNTLKGLIVTTLNITLFLPAKEMIQGLSTKIFVPLSGSDELKNVLTSNLLEQPLHAAVDIFNQSETLNLFGYKVKFAFERGIHLGEFNLGICLAVLFLGALLLVLSIYLVMTLQNLKNSLLKIEEINSGLEETVKERTKNLNQAHSEIKEILDNLDDAIMVIDESYTIPEMHSPASRVVLGEDNLVGKSIFDTLFKDLSSKDQKDSRHLFSFRNIIGSDEFQWMITDGDYHKQIKYICPNHQAEKTLAIRYSPFIVDGQIERMLIVASDITAHLKLQEDFEKQQKESGEKTNALQEMMQTSKKGLSSFMDETEDRMGLIQKLIDGCQENEDNLDIWKGVFRELHTLKGNSRFYKLSGFSDTVHQLEEDAMGLLSDGKDQQTLELFDEGWNKLKKSYEIYKGIYEELFKSKGESSLEILPVIKLLNSELEKEHIASLLEAQNKGSIFEVGHLFQSYQDMVEEVAEKLGKKVELKNVPQGIWLDSSLEGVLKDCFTHVIRNGLDHGLESPEEREKIEKSSQGSIWIEMETHEDSLILKLRDDGRGVDTNKVKHMALKKNLIHKDEDLNDHQIIELLFHSGFSTKDKATDVSGRGVGLDAVRESLKSKDCLVKIESLMGKGSATCITIPLNKVFKTYNTKK